MLTHTHTSAHTHTQTYIPTHACIHPTTQSQIHANTRLHTPASQVCACTFTANSTNSSMTKTSSGATSATLRLLFYVSFVRLFVYCVGLISSSPCLFCMSPFFVSLSSVQVSFVHLLVSFVCLFSSSLCFHYRSHLYVSFAGIFSCIYVSFSNSQRLFVSSVGFICTSLLQVSFLMYRSPVHIHNKLYKLLPHKHFTLLGFEPLIVLVVGLFCKSLFLYVGLLCTFTQQTLQTLPPHSVRLRATHCHGCRALLQVFFPYIQVFFPCILVFFPHIQVYCAHAQPSLHTFPMIKTTSNATMSHSSFFSECFLVGLFSCI